MTDISPAIASPATTLDSLRSVAVGDVDLYERVSAAVAAVGDQPPPHGLTHQEEARIGPMLLRSVIAALGSDGSAIAADHQLRGALCEVAAVAATHLFPLLSGHFALATPAIGTHGDGSEYQRTAKALLDTGDAVGVLGLTELGGTNGNDQTTTATWDHALDGFVLNTPTPAGMKFMPNAAGPGTTVLVVLARLIIDGADRGVLPFLLPPLTGRNPDPTIRIVELPEKQGGAMAHAMIAFDGLVVPRHALLGGTRAHIARDGEFRSDLTARQRFRAAISMLDSGRLDLAAAAVATARAAVAGVLAYARQRSPGGTPMLERDAVRRDLVRSLVQVWASTALVRVLRAMSADAPARPLWVMLAKPLLSSTALQVLLVCQARMGAQGTLRVNWLPDWITATIGLCIAEGENQVLAVTAGRLRSRLEDLELPGTPQTLPQWSSLLAARESALVEAVRDGAHDHAARALGPDGAAEDAATAAAERAAAHALLVTAASTTDPRARGLLEALADAYAWDRIITHCHWYTSRGLLDAAEAVRVGTDLHRTYLSLLDEMDVLVAAFAIPSLTGPVYGGNLVDHWTDYFEQATQ
ncbi:acyl-CoA dehydrogenase family protein [Nocardia takedensis]